MSARRPAAAPLALVALLVLLAAPALAAAAEEGAGEEATGREAAPEGAPLERAFRNLYGCDMRTVLELTLYEGEREAGTRLAEIARKRIEGRVHSYARFLEPSWLRETRMLILDGGSESDEYFLFLPARERIRRVTSAQSTDAFVGSDLWYEDLERRRAEDFRVTAVAEETREGEPVTRVAARRADASAYQRVEFTIAERDAYLLEAAFFREGAERPFKTIRADRAHLLRAEGHVLPTRLEVADRHRGTRTVVLFRQLEVNPELPDSLFRSVALEHGRRIPGLDAETAP